MEIMEGLFARIKAKKRCSKTNHKKYFQTFFIGKNEKVKIFLAEYLQTSKPDIYLRSLSEKETFFIAA